MDYPFDVMYFDGPYQGMQNAKSYCHCTYCEAAYRKKFGKPVPNQDEKMSAARTKSNTPTGWPTTW